MTVSPSPAPASSGVADAGLPAGPVTLTLNRLHYPVTVLGPGIRAGIWLQGCTIGCPGCMSRDTWDPAAGVPVEPADVIGWLDRLTLVTGVTVSGGEPFQQPVALAALLRAIRAWSAARQARGEPAVDVMAYSGYTAPALTGHPARRAALQLCDVVVTGPYLRARAPGGSWRGSANQRLVIRTPLGVQRFGPDGDARPHRPGLQLGAAGSRWWLVGVPGPGELDRLQDRLAGRGIVLTQTSWATPTDPSAPTDPGWAAR